MIDYNPDFKCDILKNPDNEIILYHVTEKKEESLKRGHIGGNEPLYLSIADVEWIKKFMINKTKTRISRGFKTKKADVGVIKIKLKIDDVIVDMESEITQTYDIMKYDWGKRGFGAWSTRDGSAKANVKLPELYDYCEEIGKEEFKNNLWVIYQGDKLEFGKEAEMIE